MTDARPHKTPGPDHLVSLERSSVHVVVRSDSAVIAETDRALEMREASYPAVLYIPIDDVTNTGCAAANTTRGARTRARPRTTTSSTATATEPT